MPPETQSPPTTPEKISYWTRQNPPPITGKDNPDLASFDRLMTDFLIDNQAPGAALAVSRHGHLVYSRGFGWADVATAQAVQPQSLFRIASISKPLTAVAVMRLVEEGKIQLDAPAFQQLPCPPTLLGEMTPDERLQDVTVRQLLQHRGGWDRDKSFDPMFKSVEIAQRSGVSPPALQKNIIDYMLGIPLDFPPGQRYAYSNFGYCVLGRIIEKAANTSYADFVQKAVLRPLGITGMRLGRSRLPDRAPGEVRYYDPNRKLHQSLFAEDRQQVEEAYGAWCVEAMDAHGGWLASAPDIVRLAMAFDDPDHSPLLNPQSARTMFQSPPGPPELEPDGSPKPSFYACGWQVRQTGNDGQFNASHGGLLSGCCSTLMVRRFDATDWAVFFNTDSNPQNEVLVNKIDPLIHHAADAVQRWPTDDADSDCRDPLSPVPHARGQR